jgi:ABC-type transport system involved in multi-copper enzyme maturation permease subunit
MHAFVVATLTVRDLLRRRILALLVLFATALILMSYVLRDLTIGQWQRLITDLGLGAIDFSLTLLAIFVGASLVSGDLDRRTALPLLAKPLSRGSYVCGRFLGLTALLFGLAGAMVLGTALMLVLAHQSGESGYLLQNALTIGVGSMVVGAVAILFSTITSSTLASIAALTMTLGGHLTSNLQYFGQKIQAPLAKAVMLGFVKIVPNLEALNLKDFAAHAQVVPTADVVSRLVYGVAYSAVCVALASLAFARRDLR